MWTPRCSARSFRSFCLLAVVLALLGLGATGGCNWPKPDPLGEQCTEVTLPQRTITVDGETSDWAGLAPQLLRPDGKQSAGQFSISALSAVTDAEHIYLRLAIATEKTTADPQCLGQNCCDDQICQSSEDISCPDCVPQLRIALKTTGFRGGQISLQRDGGYPSPTWRCEGNWWNDSEGGTPISCAAALTATAGGLEVELSLSRANLGPAVSVYPVLERWQDGGGPSTIDDEIGCVWARLDAPTEAGPDAPADGGIGPDLAPDTAPPPIPGSWVAIPAGTFTMGSLPTDACYEANQDQHEVTLTYAFEMQDTEVTQGQFAQVRGYNPSAFTACGSDCPVEMVNWHEAVAYCNALSGWAGHATCYQCGGGGTGITCSEVQPYDGPNIYTCPGYRLPTEAEWEYAYRAGSTSGLYNGPSNPLACHACSDVTADGMAWYTCNSSGTTHPVKQKDPNQWMLYDMAGNVWEWCHDWYLQNLGPAPVTDPWGPPSGSERLVRGGGWGLHAYTLRAAFRNEHVDPTERSWNGGLASFGFRCVRTIFP